MSSSTFDRAGVALSALCIVHCVVLPLTTSLLPVMGLLTESEFIHKGLVGLAVIPALFAFTGSISSPYAAMIRSLGLLGILTLITGAFFEPLHDHETSLTIMGAVCLGGAHILRTALNRPHIHRN